MTDKTKYPTLASALVAFQANIPTITKDATADTGKFSYDYASLDALTPIIFKALTDVGLAYVAAPDINEQGVFGLRARLIHESGEEIGGLYPLGNPNNPAQTIGSAITYARRYALLALTGVAPQGSDDDGSSATSAQAEAQARAAVKPATDTLETLRAEMSTIIDGSAGKVTGETANQIMAEVTGGKDASKWTVADMRKGRDKLKEQAGASA